VQISTHDTRDGEVIIDKSEVMFGYGYAPTYDPVISLSLSVG